MERKSALWMFYCKNTNNKDALVSDLWFLFIFTVIAFLVMGVFLEPLMKTLGMLDRECNSTGLCSDMFYHSK